MVTSDEMSYWNKLAANVAESLALGEDREIHYGVYLCRSNLKMMKSTPKEIRYITDNYPTWRKLTDCFKITRDARSAEYEMARRKNKRLSDYNPNERVTAVAVGRELIEAGEGVMAERDGELERGLK